MPTRKNPLKFYPLNQSILYKLKSRSKLAKLFDLPLKDLEGLAKRTNNYNVFPINNGKGKSRQVEVPKNRLKVIHYKLFKLLQRIEPPPYLHSGIKGRSYITNAKVHVGCSRCITLDIKKFFPSTLGWHIFEFFRDVMQCSSDVAGLLTSICTFDNHVPTGSCLSQTIAFYAHYKMFEEIYSLTRDLGLTETCYVDDIAISGDKANRSTLYKVRGILKRRGLDSPRKKERVYEIGYPKIITGSVVVQDGLRLPNRKHKLIHDEVEQLMKIDDAMDKVGKLDTIIGRAVAASQSDPSFVQRVEKLRKEKKRLEKIVGA